MEIIARRIVVLIYTKKGVYIQKIIIIIIIIEEAN